MIFPGSRREFMRQLVLIGVAGPTVARGAPPAGGAPGARLGNGVLEVHFDGGTGQLEVGRTDGRRLLVGAVAVVQSGRGRRTTGEATYAHAQEARRVADVLGVGQQLVVRSRDGQGELDFEWRVTLYEGRSAVIVEVCCRNVSKQPVVVEHLEPLCARRETAGGLHWPDSSTLLTNGAMYYDPGAILPIAELGPEGRRSWWNLGIFGGYDREGLVCGYLDNQAALGQWVVRREGEGVIGLTAESVLAKGFVLEPGVAVSSGRLLMQLAPSPYLALEEYAAAMGACHQARVRSVVNGWCDWFYAFEHITEAEVLRNAEQAARVLKPYGLEYIQVDEGFQRWHGDWEGNAKFPHGMQWLADRIRALGLKPGIWIAPYVISEPSEVFQQHPDWLLRNADGSLKRVGPWPSEDSDWARNENPRRYGLDITHPGAAAWLEALFDTVANRWGYEMIKIDFVDWSLLAAHRYHDPTVSRAAAYRKGFEIMRRAIGPQCHLQDCGPGPVTVGLLDSMRIELDQNYGFRRETWKQYFGSPTSSAAAAAKRYYFHGRTWINDADHVCLNALSLPQAQAAATLIALTGGNVISGDRLPDLDASRLDILRKIYPAFGQAAWPVDLLERDPATVFVLKIVREFGEWTVVGVFNPSETDSIERQLPLERLGLSAEAALVAYDFWNERIHGIVAGELHVPVPPTSVRLLSLHRLSADPQVISTDRHVLQGAFELERVRWDPATRTLRGTSLGPLNTAHNVTVFVPEPQRWVQGGPFLFQDRPDYSFKMMEAQLLRVRVRFDRGTRVDWEIAFAEFLGRA